MKYVTRNDKEELNRIRVAINQLLIEEPFKL